MADDAIEYVRGLNEVSPDQPFFLYYVPGATHAPHHPTPEWIDKFKGKFDMGWNALRDQIFANQKKLGVIPQNAQLTPWPKELPEWASLSPEQKKLYARQMEVYAAYLAYTDHEIGRVVQAVQDMGKLDNTLVIYISGDNGASPEGTLNGTPNEVASLNAATIPIPDQMKFYDAWGSDKTYPHFAVAWAWALDTPFQWTKEVASHFGGTRQGVDDVVAGAHRDAGESRNRSPRHRHRADHPGGVRYPAAERVRRDSAEANRGREHGIHMGQGQRERPHPAHHAILRDARLARHLQRRLDRVGPAHRAAVGDWQAVASARGVQLGTLQRERRLDREQRPGAEGARQARDAAKLFTSEATKYSVFPLDNSTVSRLIAAHPSLTAGRDVFTYSGARQRQFREEPRACSARSYTITAEIEIPEAAQRACWSPRARRFGGYGYLLKGKPTFA